MRKATAPIPDDARAALLALLRSISEELHLIACEVVELGEVLSGEHSAAESDMRMRKLQSFDLIGQHVIAQARLLRGLERRLSQDQSGDHDGLDSLIEAVPFHQVRQRLFAAFGGRDTAAAPPAGNSDDTDWFV